MSSIEVKVTFRKETRKITLQSATGLDSFTELKSKCREYFNIKNINNFNFVFPNSEGKQVVVSNATELASAKKLKLVRKLQVKSDSPKEAKTTAIPTLTAILTPLPTTPAKQPAQPERAKKCGMQKFKKERIIEIKAVRLQWTLGYESGYLLANRNGGIILKSQAKGLRCIWFLKKSDKGDIFCSPAIAPKRHLRMMPATFEINLNEGEMGPWSRWALIPVKETTEHCTAATLSSLGNAKVQLASNYQKNHVIGVKTIEKICKKNNQTKQKRVAVGVPSDAPEVGSINIESEVHPAKVLLGISLKLHKRFACAKKQQKKAGEVAIENPQPKQIQKVDAKPAVVCGLSPRLFPRPHHVSHAGPRLVHAVCHGRRLITPPGLSGNVMKLNAHITCKKL